MTLYEKIIEKIESVAVIGLGYVGLPIAAAFSKKIKTIGFDIDSERIEKFIQGIDVTNELGEDIKNLDMEFTCEETRLRDSKFLVVAVPTPVHKDKTPDLKPVSDACRIVGRNLSKGSIVVFESTVYPGVTEDICVPILEETSGFICGRDFRVGYSPERINPGDKVHTLSTIVKIVSGMDEETLEEIARVYELIIDAGVYRAGSIKVAEAAKLVENAQRDINIAFMNELAIVFDKMKINTKEVVDAMSTKWNALGFTPGLVGGHCIGVDPYYFIYEAERLGYHSQIILSGRKINDSMGEYIAATTVKQLIKANKLVMNSSVYVFGFTFKENCPDIRNSKVLDIVEGLKEYGVSIKVVDPFLKKEEVKADYGIDVVELEEVKQADGIVFAVSHKEFLELSFKQLESFFNYHPDSERVIIDVKSIFDKKKMCDLGYSYWSL